MSDIGDDPAAVEAADDARMRAAGAQIVEGVEQRAADWVVGAVASVIDAWGGLDEAARAATIARARDAGRRAATRVGAELRELLATDPAAQRATPLELVRSLRLEATGVLAAAGVPHVERDRFEERAFPDDVYAVVPRSLDDLGDEELGPQLLAWGLRKSAVLRARGERLGPT